MRLLRQVSELPFEAVSAHYNTAMSDHSADASTAETSTTASTKVSDANASDNNKNKVNDNSAAKDSTSSAEEGLGVGALQSWLIERGIPADTWGKATKTKEVKDLWNEMRLQEAGIELWETEEADAKAKDSNARDSNAEASAFGAKDSSQEGKGDGTGEGEREANGRVTRVRPIRTLHVLRGKVCSEKSRKTQVRGNLRSVIKMTYASLWKIMVGAPVSLDIYLHG